jgi:preprotein translocase subunit YajC
MSFFISELPLVLAQAQDGGGSAWVLFGYMAMFAFIVYFIMIRPQRQQEQKRRTMIDAMKKNDKVLTTGGIYGTVISVDPSQDRVVLRVDDEKGVKVSFARSSVARVLEATPEKTAESS